MAESFSALLREQAQGVWRRIFEHPFLKDVQGGRLPVEKFRYYLSQDYHYLEAFGRCVAIALAKARDPDVFRLLSQRLMTPIERPLHRKLFDLLEVDVAQVERLEPSPTNLAYMNHMLTVASLGSPGEIAAALLPCPWTYHEIGRLGIVVPEKLRLPVYREWASFYATGGLEGSVRAWRELLDRSAAEASPAVREAMASAFLTSSRYEYMFWDMAYRMEQWPL